MRQSGLYSLILVSKKSDAVRFQRWITSIVLPSIRKTKSCLHITPLREALPVNLALQETENEMLKIIIKA
jgi:prophage antirepressor-like protein